MPSTQVFRNAQTMLIISLVIFLFCFQSTSTDARPNKKTPLILNDDTWSLLMEGEWMFNLYAPWCPACKKLEPEWEKFAEWSDDLNINVASADVTQNTGLSGRFLIRGLPTIYHVKDGVFRVYSGPREHTALINFIEEQGWKSIESVSRWIAPNTFQMSFVAYLFKISMVLRDMHNHLVENVGIPAWASYLMFALATVLVGGTLGVLWVFIIDMFIPAQQTSETTRSSKTKPKDKNKNAVKTDSDLDDPETTNSETNSGNERLRRRAKN